MNKEDEAAGVALALAGIGGIILVVAMYQLVGLWGALAALGAALLLFGACA